MKNGIKIWIVAVMTAIALVGSLLVVEAKTDNKNASQQTQKERDWVKDSQKQFRGRGSAQSACELECVRKYRGQGKKLADCIAECHLKPRGAE